MQQHGISPVVTTILLALISLGMAGGAAFFIQSQQEGVTEQLSSALGEGLTVQRIRCNGQNVTMLLENDLGEPLKTGRAAIRVRQRGDPRPSFTNQDLIVNGSYLEANGSGWLNRSVNNHFRSGNSYTISLSFTGSNQRISQRCLAGTQWWDLDWEYRRQIVMEKKSSGTYRGQFDINATRIHRQNKLREDCNDFRVSNGTVNDYELDSTPSNCNVGNPGTNTTVEFNAHFGESFGNDTYLYYGNLRASDATSSPSGTAVTVHYLEAEESVN